MINKNKSEKRKQNTKKNSLSNDKIITYLNKHNQKLFYKVHFVTSS